MGASLSSSLEDSPPDLRCWCPCLWPSPQSRCLPLPPTPSSRDGRRSCKGSSIAASAPRRPCRSASTCACACACACAHAHMHRGGRGAASLERALSPSHAARSLSPSQRLNHAAGFTRGRLSYYSHAVILFTRGHLSIGAQYCDGTSSVDELASLITSDSAALDIDEADAGGASEARGGSSFCVVS